MPTIDGSLLAALLILLLALAVLGAFLVIVIRLALRPFRQRSTDEPRRDDGTLG